MAEEGTPQLDALQVALDRGDIGEVRRLMLSLTDDELDLLREDVGSAGVERALQSASRNRRGVRRGKVLVLPGIMGSLLDRFDRAGASERIWISITNLIGGAMDELELTVPDGLPPTPNSTVRAVGVHRGTYLPLLTELDTEWDVRPFAFDWREDIAKTRRASTRRCAASAPASRCTSSPTRWAASSPATSAATSRRRGRPWTTATTMPRAGASSCWARPTAARSRRCWR